MLNTLKIEDPALLPNSKPENNVQDLSEFIIDWKADYGEIIPVWKVRGETVCTLGDVGLVTGASKSGKSHVVQKIIVAALKGENQKVDTFCQWAMPANGKKIYYVDTEQHPSKTQFSGKKIAKELGMKMPPSNLLYMNIRECDKALRLPRLLKHIEKHKKGEVLFWLIDGLADLIDDVNNSEASNDILEKLMKVAGQKQCSFIVNLHENPNGGKLRGHLGSESTRKCSGYVSVKKDKERNCNFIQPGVSREGGDFEPVPFKWIDGVGFQALDEYETEKLKLSAKERKEKDKYDEHLNACKAVFDTAKEFNKKQFIDALRLVWKGGSSEKTAQRVMKFCQDNDMINYTEATGLVTPNFD